MNTPACPARVQGSKKRPCPMLESPSGSPCDQNIDEIMDRVRSDGGLPNHLKDLLWFLCDCRKQVDHLLQRNRELENKVESLIVENEKLKNQLNLSSGIVNSNVPSQSSDRLVPVSSVPIDSSFSPAQLETLNEIERSKWGA